MTSSPGLITASTRLKKLCLPPHDDQDLLGRVVEAVVALEFGDDRLLQAGGAAHRGVFGEARVDGLDRRVLDVLRGVEIGLAGAEADNVAAGRLELGGTGGDGEGGGGLDGLNAVREFQMVPSCIRLGGVLLSTSFSRAILTRMFHKFA